MFSIFPENIAHGRSPPLRFFPSVLAPGLVIIPRTTLILNGILFHTHRHPHMSFPEPPSRIDARLYIHRFLGRSRIAAVATSPKNKYRASHENKQNRIQNIRGFSFLKGRKLGAVVHVVGKLIISGKFPFVYCIIRRIFRHS